MTDFREPMGIPQSGEPAQEPRRGLIPFNHDVDTTSSRIESQTVRAGSLGNVSLLLTRFYPNRRRSDLDNNPCFTFDKNGNIVKGTSREFREAGYYSTVPYITLDEGSIKSSDKIEMHVWIDGANTTAIGDLYVNPQGHGIAGALWSIETADGVGNSGDQFFLPVDNNVLRRVRVSFEAKMEPPKGVSV